MADEAQEARQTKSPNKNPDTSSDKNQKRKQEEDQETTQVNNWLKRIPKWLNDGASLIAALLGILITWQTFKLNSDINRLNESLEASALIGELINSLTSEDLKQDIALLTLDYALTSDPEENDQERENRHKKLVAEISASLLNNRQLAEEDDGNTFIRSRQIEQESRTILKILERLAAEGENLENEQKLDYQRIAAQAIADYQATVKNSEAPTDKAQAQINYDEPAAGDSEEVIVPQIAEKDEALTSQQSLELATSAVAVSAIAESASAESPRVIYLHYDSDTLTNAMNALKTSLERDWFVTDQIELVGSRAFNCSTNSDIRFFHAEDEALARELRSQLSTNLPNSALSAPLNDIKLVDLSNWSRANLVPEKQLELWVVAKGAECRESRAANAGN